MPREILDPDGTRWSCAQAYAGLPDHALGDEAARVDGTDRVRVVCTPSGGSRSVELELAADWADSLGDEELLERLRRERG